MDRDTAESDEGAAPGTGRAYQTLRHRDFRLLWSAELASTLGSQMQRVAIAYQVFQITGDPLQLGLLGLFRFAPIALFGLAGGVVADRRDRRRTLLWTQSILLLTSAVLAVLTARDTVTMPIIYALTFFSFAVTAVNGPTRQALIPSLVPRAEIAGAMTMHTLASTMAAVAGPAVGGFIIAHFGIATTYAIDAVSFLLVIGAVVALRARSRIAVSTIGGFAAAIEGLRFLRGSPVLLGVMTVDFLATFFGASMVLMPVFAEDILGVGAEGLGVLYAAPAFGAVLGSVVMSFARIPHRPGAGVLAAIGVYGVCIVGFGLSVNLWLSLALLAVSGAADAVSMTLRHTIRNLAPPDALRGRVAAAHSTFAMGGPQLGEFEAGVAARFVGAGPSVALGGVGTLVAVAIVALVVPGIARYRTHDDAEDGTYGEPST